MKKTRGNGEARRRTLREAVLALRQFVPELQAIERVVAGLQYQTSRADIRVEEEGLQALLLPLAADVQKKYEALTGSVGDVSDAAEVLRVLRLLGSLVGAGLGADTLARGFRCWADRADARPDLFDELPAIGVNPRQGFNIGRRHFAVREGLRLAPDGSLIEEE